jgi:hypothetical protein
MLSAAWRTYDGTMQPDEIHVECYAGSRGDEVPRRFHVAGRVISVIGVVSRWATPDTRAFKVTGDDGGAYVLVHDARTDRWTLRCQLR